MGERAMLSYDSRYDQTGQRLIAVFAAQLDDQQIQLKKLIAGLDAPDLEWQLYPGRNTIGQLVAHIAVAEVFWVAIAPAGLHPGPKSDEKMKSVLGISGADDGIPLPENGAHPAPLEGFTLDQYFSLLDHARAETHRVLQSWTDDILDDEFKMEDHTFSRMWVLYHILEHFACHFGQIRLLLQFLKRDRARQKNIELS
jgi:uncharacterized damage-inducible protein DinB